MRKNENEMSDLNIANIFQVNFISAGICNLQCKFCFLYKNEAYKMFNNEVREAWQSGSYVENVKKVFERLEADPARVKALEFWGGETLLQIKDITPNLKSLFRFFPFVDTIRVSTNWCINVQDFIDFLVELDSVLKSPLNFRLQLSIDGLSGDPLTTGHYGSVEVYKRNIREFCNFFNNHKFKNVFVSIFINANVKKDVYFREFSTVDGIKRYIEEMSDFCNEISDMCISDKITFNMSTVLPGYVLPTLDTVEDGLEYSRILNLWNYVYYSYFANNPKYNIDSSTYFMLGSSSIKPDPCFRENPECSELACSRTILPDGTIVCCSGAFIYGKDYSEKLLLKEGRTELASQGRMFKRLEYNPINCSDEDIENIEWYINTGLKKNNKTHLNYNFALAKELARAGQISREYLMDDDLLLNHVIILSNFNDCHKENILLSNTYWLNSPGVFRRYLNGALQSQIGGYLNYEEN